MIKYTSKQVIDKALHLADLQNTDFLTYGEKFEYLNDAYRTVYQDAINAGEQQYLKVYRLEGYGSRDYDLPSDLYQILSITTDNGVEVRRKSPRDSEDSSGYTIANGKLYLSKVVGSVILKYYPIPETITSKAKEVEMELPNGFEVLDSYGTYVINDKLSIFDVSKHEFLINNEEESSVDVDSIVLGKYEYLTWKDGVCKKYDYNGDNEILFAHPILNEDGTFCQYKGYSGCCNTDKTVFFYLDDDENNETWIYVDKYNLETETYDTTKIINVDSVEVYTPHLRYIYWDGSNACILGHVGVMLFDDGVYMTLDINGNNITLMKTDLETGYGFLSIKGGRYFVDGWLPETKIDYPNNVFFSMVAYKLAISFKSKQNAETVFLEKEYDKLIKTYTSSLSVDGQSYPTIRNVYQISTGW